MSTRDTPPPPLTGKTPVNLAINNSKKRAGRKKFHETRHPVFRGIRHRGLGKWVTELREPNKKSKIWLGTFTTLEMAARAHDVVAIALRGPTACLNYEDSTWLLPVPASVQTKDIQKAAHEAAEAYRPKATEEIEVQEKKETLNDFDFMDINEGTIPMSPLMVEDDEESVFSMQGLLDHMADDLMIPRPQYTIAADDSVTVDDVPLWNF